MSRINQIWLQFESNLIEFGQTWYGTSFCGGDFWWIKYIISNLYKCSEARFTIFDETKKRRRRTRPGPQFFNFKMLQKYVWVTAEHPKILHTVIITRFNFCRKWAIAAAVAQIVLSCHGCTILTMSTILSEVITKTIFLCRLNEKVTELSNCPRLYLIVRFGVCARRDAMSRGDKTRPRRRHSIFEQPSSTHILFDSLSWRWWWYICWFPRALLAGLVRMIVPQIMCSLLSHISLHCMWCGALLLCLVLRRRSTEWLKCINICSVSETTENQNRSRRPLGAR